MLKELLKPQSSLRAQQGHILYEKFKSYIQKGMDPLICSSLATVMGVFTHFWTVGNVSGYLGVECPVVKLSSFHVMLLGVATTGCLVIRCENSA